jgi:hypothetical protein
MFRKIAASFVLVVLTSTATAMAADTVTPVAAIGAEAAIEQTAPLHALVFEALKTPSVATRGTLLPSLYVSLAGLNAYDAYSTLKGVARGASESNGVIGGAAGSSTAMWAIKGGVTAGSIVLSERLWRSGRRAQAIGMMVASNAVMAAVGAHNNRVLGTQR